AVLIDGNLALVGAGQCFCPVENAAKFCFYLSHGRLCSGERLTSRAYALAATQLVGACVREPTYVPPCMWDTSAALQKAKSPTLQGVVFEFWCPHTVARSVGCSRGIESDIA